LTGETEKCTTEFSLKYVRYTMGEQIRPDPTNTEEKTWICSPSEEILIEIDLLPIQQYISQT
jgi:hypothetical protein